MLKSVREADSEYEWRGKDGIRVGVDAFARGLERPWSPFATSLDNAVGADPPSHGVAGSVTMHWCPSIFELILPFRVVTSWSSSSLARVLLSRDVTFSDVLAVFEACVLRD